MMLRMRCGLGAYSSTDGLKSAFPSVSTYMVGLCRAVWMEVRSRRARLAWSSKMLRSARSFGSQSIDRHCFEARLEILVKLLLIRQAGDAHVVQHVVELLIFELVQPGAGGRGRRERKSCVNELVGQPGDTIGSAATSSGCNRECNYNYEFGRHAAIVARRNR